MANLTADKSDKEVTEFYEQLRYMLRFLKNHKINIIIGDVNANVRRGLVEDAVGIWFGSSKWKGDYLVWFGIEESVYDLLFQKFYALGSPQDNTNLIVQNQINFFIINKRFQKSATWVAAYLGADNKK